MEDVNQQYLTNMAGQFEPQSGEPEKVLAWEMIEEGRYRPRRIRGSLLGRDLG
jgi:hypothetical protein